MSGTIGIKIPGGKVKKILSVNDSSVKKVRCSCTKDNQKTIKIDFFILEAGNIPKGIGNLVIKDLKSMSKGDHVADLRLKMKGSKLVVYVSYSHKGVMQHFSVNFKTETTGGPVKSKYLQYGSYITPGIKKLDNDLSLEDQLEQDLEEDLFIEEELEKGGVVDRAVVQEKPKKKKNFVLLKVIFFMFYAVFASALILLLVALTFKEVSINELLKMIGVNLNLNF